MTTTETARAPGASAAAIQSHYDIGDDFFALFQDPTRTYSCAMFASDGETLEAAQERKHDWHALQAGAHGAGRVLDVGCGWGATLRRLLDVHGVQHVTGLTLSRAQLDHVRATLGDRVDVRLESWVDHVPTAPYDAIISIGAFEHFARYGVSQADKLAGYQRYFARCRELLRPGGRMTLQTIAYGDIPRERRHLDTFIADEIFPESELPRLADIAEASEGEFEIVGVRNDRADYARTCRHWFERLRARRLEAVALVGEAVTARYERYLRTFSYSFALGAFQLLRVVLARVDHRRNAWPHSARRERRTRRTSSAPAALGEVCDV